MRLTKETDYALRLVQALANGVEDEFITAHEMADGFHIPYRFLLRVLTKLKRAKIVASRQGIDGGYRLGRAPGEITYLQVVEAIEGDLNINHCLRDHSLCSASLAPQCPVHCALGDIQQSLAHELNQKTFAKR